MSEIYDAAREVREVIRELTHELGASLSEIATQQGECGHQTLSLLERIHEALVALAGATRDVSDALHAMYFDVDPDVADDEEAARYAISRPDTP